MGRPPKFTREKLQTAALSIVDEQGLEALSMRALAQALGTGPMTLYSYVDSREGLDVLVVEAIIGKAVWTHPPGAGWQDDLRYVARAIWQAVRLHPNAIPIVLTRRSRTPAIFAVAESLLGPLRGAGFANVQLLAAFRAVTALIVGMAQGELTGPLALKAGESAAETIAKFEALPRDTYPGLIEAALATDRSSPEGEFDLAMSFLVRGLESQIASQGESDA